MLALVTGATGKVGRHFIERFLDEERFSAARLRALCHNRMLDAHDRVDVVRGILPSRTDVEAAMQDVTHVLHLATCKETPDDVMDVTVKGLFWLLEAFRTSAYSAAIHPDRRRRRGRPLLLRSRRADHRGDAAPRLSRLLRAVQGARRGDAAAICASSTASMAAACARPGSWRRTTSNIRSPSATTCSAGRSGRTRCRREAAAAYRASGAVPLLLDADSEPLKRNFVHVDDLVAAILAAIDNPNARGELFNICMDEPVDYGEVAALSRRDAQPSGRRDTEPLSIRTGWTTPRRSFMLGWRPQYDLKKLIDSAWDYVRPPTSRGRSGIRAECERPILVQKRAKGGVDEESIYW